MKKMEEEKVVQVCYSGNGNPYCLTSYGRVLGVAVLKGKDIYNNDTWSYYWANITPNLKEIK